MTHIVTDPNDEDQPDPDKYDRWIVRAIPPRPALSAGRSRTSNRAIGDPGLALSGGIGLGQKNDSVVPHRRRTLYPPFKGTSKIVVTIILGQDSSNSQLQAKSHSRCTSAYAAGN